MSVSNPKSLTVLSLCSMFTVLATVCVILRLWARKLKKQGLYLSDDCVLLSLVLSYALLGILVASASRGLGQHVSEVDPWNLMIFVKLSIALSSTWIVAITAVKISILYLYIAIFRVPRFIKIVWIFIILQIVFCLTALLQIFLICRPFAMNWDRTVKGTCGDRTGAYLSHHIIILVLDFSIVALPMPVLWRLKMSRSKKLGISFMFGLGIVICVISIMRIVWIHRVNTLDITYNWADLFLFTALEPLLGIILACLPLIQPVTSPLTQSVMSWSRRKLKNTWNSSSKPAGQGSSRSDSISLGQKGGFKRLEGGLPCRAESVSENQRAVDFHSLGDLEGQCELSCGDKR